MKKHLSTILLVIVLVAGLSLLLYPTVSDYWNSFHQSQAIVSYTENVTEMNDVSYDHVWAAAHAYNETLHKKYPRYYFTEKQTEEYNALLNVAGNGIMCYIEIDKINCKLPIYHGTDEGVLQVAVGHIAGSSLPVGGVGTHCAVSGHRGLPSAKLFTNLDQMVIGDTFLVHVLDEILTYEVDQILVVEPDDMSALEIDPEQDYFTLVTCTPYGINSHRLLVRGHRVETVIEEEKAPVVIEPGAEMIDEWLVVPFIAGPILFVLLLILMIQTRKKR